MPPPDTTPQSRLNYFIRLLAALSLQAGGELRIPRKFLRAVEEEDKRQALLEDTNFDTDELVLRFGSKHAAFYPVESDTCASSKTSPPPQPARPEAPQQVREPLTEKELARLQRTINARLAQARLKHEQTLRERQQEDLSSILEPNSRG